VCDRQISLITAADAALRPFMAGSDFQSQAIRQEPWPCLLKKYTIISGSSKLTQFLLACMRVRYRLLPSYDKVERWITPYRKAFGSAEKILGVRDTTPSWCVVRVWPGASVIQLVSCCNVFVQFPYPMQQFHDEEVRFCKLTCNWAPSLLHADPPTFFQPWKKAWHNLTWSNKSYWYVSLLISVSLSWTSGTDTWSFGHLFLINHPIERNSKTLITSGAQCLHKELWLPILLIGFLDTYFLTFLKMSFTVWWLVSDIVSTSFALNQRLEIPPFPLLATCVRLMNVQDGKHVLFYCTHPQMVSFLRKYAF